MLGSTMSAPPAAAAASALAHRPVLLAESLEALALEPEGHYVDATFGRGGHAAAILERLGPKGRLAVFDQDPEAIEVARLRFGADPRVAIHACNFRQLAERLAPFAGQIHGVLMDLGVSSPQLDQAERGFSFSQDGPLDMRMDPSRGPSAAEWLAGAEAEEIADVLWRFGEERNSRRIARRIVEARREQPITRTSALAALIASVPGPRSRGIHPATRSFQAIRIHINGELEALEAALPQAVALLAPGGRLAVISFHSLEDRIVKRFLRAQAQGEGATLHNLRRIFPGAAEAAENPRARSAVLRVAERRP